ncbi:MAG: sn-glycerol-3-phosphate ABC transporter ATP-binding protein UgpC, partial [Deltaproteobacteria bacterium]|nr:sn-glycerol-3-phosphate ABC transporter ATP-binding protein UgpC [Deltaproteobacteria bacterium]
MASLTLQGITKNFGKVSVLENIDLLVEDGEFCVLLGPSGCGKSTLLNIVAGLLSQDRGTIELDGKRVDHLAPRDRDVAMVFQSYALYPHMTVAQNLGFGLRMRGIPKTEIAGSVQETASLLGIEDLMQRKPKELSGGQRQRVAMGRALVRRPKIFLLDEPLSNLDARLRTNVRLELKQLHQKIRGTTLYVTHDQVEAMTLGDRVVILQNGEIRQTGSPEAIYATPADTFVATFIGSPEMNLYQGNLLRKEGQSLFQGNGFSLDLGETARQLKEGGMELGIRPEDVDLSRNGASPLEARVKMVSNVGSEKYIHARLGREEITLRVSKETACLSGDIINPSLPPERLHIFF